MTTPGLASRPAAAGHGAVQRGVGGERVLVAGDRPVDGVVGLGQGHRRQGRERGADEEVLVEGAGPGGVEHGAQSYGSEGDRRAAPYGTATSDPSLKRVRTRHFQRAKEHGIKITGLTSYDCLSAAIFDEAGIDFLLVGDSAGNTVFGYDTTIPVTVDELIPLTRAVVRARASGRS